MKNCGIAYHQALSYQSSPSRTVSLFSNIFAIAIPSPAPFVLPESRFQRAGLRVFCTTCPLCTSSSACQQTWKTFSVLVAHSTYSNWRGAESKVKRSSPFFWIFFLTKMWGLYFKAEVQPFTFSLFPERCFLSGWWLFQLFKWNPSLNRQSATDLKQ